MIAEFECPPLEHKFTCFDDGISVTDGHAIAGYASLFGQSDRSRDVVLPGAYAKSLNALGRSGRRVRMLWQHDPAQPIGVWDEVCEDARGLHVKGRILRDVAKGREAIALVAAGAIDGLSIGYRTIHASRDAEGRRLLTELELWEVSLVTFPMQPSARVGAKGETPEGAQLREVAGILRDARRMLAQG